MSAVDYAALHFPLYLLVVLRVLGFVGTAPVLSSRVWPAWAKVGLALATAAWITPSVAASVPDPTAQPGDFIVEAVQETLLGLFMGLIANLLVAAVTFAGEAFDVQIGFSSAVLFDPGSGASVGLTASFLTWVFTMYFLGVGGLDGFLLAVMNSYHLVPLGHWHLPANAGDVLGRLAGLCVAIGLQMAAPLLVALLLSDVTFAMLSRAVPQMNVFIVGIPAKLFVGLALFAVVMPGVVYVLGQLFTDLFQSLSSALNWIGAG
ncbi:MAG: flagellar biosynthetic protein FliR [Alicyclobacillus sp.]|nr:flagellar biosynthetic protein FliR [Alicyclobacillus sp.]